jgi:hypothetical protein
MITKKVALFTSTLMIILLAGCGGQTPSPNTEAAASAHDQHTVPQTSKAAPSSSPKQQVKYSLDASVDKEEGGYYLKVETNLRLSSEHYEGAPVDGEGHIHFYLNDLLVGPIKDTNPYLLSILQPGTNTIRLVLAENNHTESFGVSKVLRVEKD